MYTLIKIDFPKEEKMTVPVFDMLTNRFSGENVVLDQDIFNQIVRKDIIHKVNQFNVMYNRVTSKWVRSKGEVSGSGKKPFAQKKSGRARQGCLRSPNMYHGGRAHGARPRDYYFPLNKKIRLMGLKCMLTSKFLENNLIVVNEEKLSENKSSILAKGLEFLNENRTLFVTSKTPCLNFKTASNNLDFITHVESDELNVSKLLSNKFLIFTKAALEELVDLLSYRQINYYRNKKIPPNPETKKMELPTDKYKYDFDAKTPLQFYTPVLRGSENKIREYVNNPEEWNKKIQDSREDVKQAERKAKENKVKKAVDSMYSDMAILEKRRRQLRRERKLKMMKEERKATIKKKKQADAAKASATDKKKK